MPLHAGSTLKNPHSHKMDRAVVLKKSKENKKRDSSQACFSWDAEVKQNSFKGVYEAGYDFRVQTLRASSVIWHQAASSSDELEGITAILITAILVTA